MVEDIGTEITDPLGGVRKHLIEFKFLNVDMSDTLPLIGHEQVGTLDGVNGRIVLAAAHGIHSQPEYIVVFFRRFRYRVRHLPNRRRWQTQLAYNQDEAYKPTIDNIVQSAINISI